MNRCELPASQPAILDGNRCKVASICTENPQTRHRFWPVRTRFCPSENTTTHTWFGSCKNATERFPWVGRAWWFSTKAAWYCFLRERTRFSPCFSKSCFATFALQKTVPLTERLGRLTRLPWGEAARWFSSKYACDMLFSTQAEPVLALLFKGVRLVVLDHACVTLLSTVLRRHRYGQEAPLWYFGTKGALRAVPRTLGHRSCCPNRERARRAV